MNTEIRKLFLEILINYVQMVEQELFQRWENWALDFAEQEKYEVIGGLLSRQATLATELAMSPSIWNVNIAPLILRSMVDNYINIAWILGDPLERARKYILYGLGQEKLQIEHLKVQIKNAGQNPDDIDEVRIRERWIDSQRYSFLTEVTIGSWSGIDTRKMAEEVGCLDIYNYSYQPLSSSTHNVWNHVGKFNLEICPKPLHKFHLTPLIPTFDTNIDFLLEAAELVEKTFKLFDEKTNNSEIPTSAYQELLT